MSAGSMTQTGRYVYAFLRRADLADTLDTAPAGLGDQALEIVGSSEFAAVVSPSEATKIRPQRKNLAAHQAVVGWLTNQCSVLPVAFGLIADDSQAVENLLTVHADALDNQLALVDGRVEMSLTLRWAVDNVFAFFVQRNEGLQLASQKIASGEASRDEQIEMGRQFETLLSTERDSHFDRVMAELDGLIAETDRQPERDEFDIFRVACLIERSKVEEFSDRIFKTAEGLDDNFAFALNGPWAPYSFVNLSLSFN